MRTGTSLRVAAWMVALALVALPVVGVLEGWFAASRWPVRELEIHATFQHVNATEVRAAVSPSLAAGFFAVDLDKIRDAVAALPWVARVAVSKHWPDGLDITIAEVDPVARWGSRALLGRGGRIFKVPDPAAAPDLPRFDAPADRTAAVLAFYRTAQGDFRPYRLRVAEVHLSRRGGWSLRLTNGSRVEVGAERPERRLARFVAALPILTRGRGDGFAYADLRYSNGFAVRWPDGSSPAAPTSFPPTSAVTHHVVDGNT